MSFEQPETQSFEKAEEVKNIDELLELNPAIQKRQQERIESMIENKDREFLTNEEERTVVEETLFEYTVMASLQDIFEETLEETGFSQEEIDEIRDTFIGMDDKELLRVFSTQAYENKERMLEYCKSKVESGELTAEELPNFLHEKAEDLGFDVGFHASDEDIRPTEGKWGIEGREADHRFNNVPMAYYSTDYKHIYRKGSPDYLYMVRIQEGKGTGHKEAGESWGMAPSLSVIARLDLDEVDDLVQGQINEYQEQLGEENEV